MPHVAGIVTRKHDDEETLRKRIKRLKERERIIRQERHKLEAKLREKIFKRYKEMEEKIA